MIAQLLCFPKQTALLKGLEFCFLCDTSQSICDFFFFKSRQAVRWAQRRTHSPGFHWTKLRASNASGNFQILWERHQEDNNIYQRQWVTLEETQLNTGSSSNVALHSVNELLKSLPPPMPSMVNHLPRLPASALSSLLHTTSPLPKSTHLSHWHQQKLTHSWQCPTSLYLVPALSRTMLTAYRAHIPILSSSLTEVKSVNQDHTAGEILENIIWDNCHCNTMCICHPDPLFFVVLMSLLEGPASGQVW